MTIKIEEIKHALEKGLNPSKYIYLRIKEDGLDYFCNDFLSKEEETDLLTKGYIYPDLSITIKTRGILAEIAIKEPKSVSSKIDNSGLNAILIFTQLQHKLLELTGNKQKTDKIQGKSYSFLPNLVDFQERLIKVCKKYKITEEEKILKVLISYICQCHKQNNWFPTMEYYLLKDGKSRFYTDYDNFEDKQEEIEVKIEPKDIKNLF